MKRRRVQEGLLFFGCLKRIRQYDLVETGKLVMPPHLDDLVKCGVSFRYDAFTRKWIGQYIALFNVCHRVNESEEMF